MKLRIFQKGFNYSQDGQGNRLVYHLQGCNMRCPWCANPEGIPAEGALYAEQDWLRPQLCPHGAIEADASGAGDRSGVSGRPHDTIEADTPAGSVYRLDRQRCGQCKSRECLETRHRGIRLSCQEIPLEKIYDEIVRSSPLFYDGGGVTFTGGEATLQFAPLKELLIRLKGAGIHTALETNGANPRLPELFPFIGQLIMDCKHWEEERHLKYTGIPLETVKRNLFLAVQQHGQLDIRIPLIGGVNDGEEDLHGFTALFRELLEKADDGCVTFEILKYHEFGKGKWAACGLEYQMTREAHVSEEQVRKFRQSLTGSGLTCKKS